MIIEDWMSYDHPIVVSRAKDIFTPANPVNFLRCAVFNTSGIFRLARRDAILEKCEIICGGSWGRFLLLDELGNPKFGMPSVFTGSFPLFWGCAEGGLYLHSICGPGPDAVITVAWREKDAELI